MSRSDLDAHFGRVEKLVAEISQHVPAEAKGVTEFRADLAGLLVVAIAASYEACVKEVLVGYASFHNTAFAQFANNNFEKLSSRVAVSDLHRYCKLFDDNVSYKFKNLLKAKKKQVDERLGKDITTCYEQILSWRHEFAHAGRKNTTIEEAIATHTVAKRVIYCFDKAFHCE